MLNSAGHEHNASSKTNPTNHFGSNHSEVTFSHILKPRNKSFRVDTAKETSGEPISL